MTIDPEIYAKRWWITFAIMLAAIIEILDSTIVTVSLPQMMGSLGANIEQITWVLTSYIVAAAIVMPLTGFLVKTLGQKKLLLGNIIGFTICSMLCGISTNLVEIVIFRTLQGVFGASLVPLSQLILRNTFPTKEQGTAMAIWGMGIMAAPILGPTLGGYITEHTNWRWVFYINLPICSIAYFMILALIKETPRIKQKVDWLGLTLLAMAVGGFQLFLDRGNSVGWFAASSIRWLTFIWIIGFIGFVWRSLTSENPLVNIRLFKDRNFCISTSLMLVFVMMMIGQISLSPLMFQNLLDYPVITTGLAMAPRGIASMVGMAYCVRLMKKFDARFIIVAGILASLYGTYRLMHLSLDMDFHAYLFGSLLQGFGMGLFFVPLSTICLSNLKQSDIPQAAGLFSLSRNFGQSLGISILVTILTNMTQASWNNIGSHIYAFNPNLTWWQQSAGRSWHNPVTMQILAQQLQQQAQMIAFNDVAWIAGISLLLALPFVFFLTPPKTMIDASAGMH